LLLSSLVLGACSAVGPTFQSFGNVPSDKAELILFRPDMFRAGGNSLNVLVDGKQVGTLRNGGWLPITIEAGERAVELNGGFGSLMRPINATLSFASGQRRIFRATPGGMTSLIVLSSGAFPSFGSWGFQELSESEAWRELAELKRSE
jgi:hypothetical protein